MPSETDIPSLGAVPPEDYDFLSKKAGSGQRAGSSFCSANRAGFEARLRCMVEVSRAPMGLRDVPVGKGGLAERHDGRAQAQILRLIHYPRIGFRSAIRFPEVAGFSRLIECVLSL